MKYHVQVMVGGDDWTGNREDHDTVAAAQDAAHSLFWRWTSVISWRVIDDDGKVVATKGDV